MKRPKHKFKKLCHSNLPKAKDMVNESHLVSQSEQSVSPSYQLAFADQDFIYREEQRGLRLLMEWQKVEQILNDYKVDATWVMFGSARIGEKSDIEAQIEQLNLQPKSPENERKRIILNNQLKNSRHYYDAEVLAGLLSDPDNTGIKALVCTGGGPGIMEAANKGAHKAGFPSIGLNIVLPREQEPNRYITPEFCFQFHYFAVRKMHFLVRAKAIIGFPGGFGTLDEVLETLTLIQTHRIKRLPMILFGKEFWQSIINFEQLLEHGVISEQDLELFHFANSPQDAIDIIKRFYQ